MLVKSIYILNVFVKQAIFIETQENKTGYVLSCCIQQSSIHYTLLYIHSRTYVRIYRIYKSRQFENYSQIVNVLRSSSSRHRHVQLCVSEDTGDRSIAFHCTRSYIHSRTYVRIYRIYKSRQFENYSQIVNLSLIHI